MINKTMMIQCKKYVLRTIFGFLAVLLAVTSMKLDNVTVFFAKTVQAETARDVVTEQPTPDKVAHQPSHPVTKPETKQGNKLTAFPEASKETKTTATEHTQTSEEKIATLEAEGYKEDVTERTLESKTYTRGNVSETILYMDTVHYEADGKLLAYDATLEPVRANPFSRSSQTGFRMKQSDHALFIPETITETSKIEIKKEADQALGISFPELQLTQPDVTGNIAKYVVDEQQEVSIIAADTTVKVSQKFKDSLPDQTVIQYTVPEGFSLYVTADQTAIYVFDVAANKIVDYVADPMIYTTQGELIAHTTTFHLEQTAPQTYTVTSSFNVPEIPESYPIIIDYAAIQLGGTVAGPDNGGVMTYGMNVVDGDTTYGPNYSVFPEYLMLGYVMDPMYYPSGAYQGVGNLAGTDIKSLIGNNREILEANFNLFEFTASNSSFADYPININVSLIEKDYPGRPDGITWNSWHGSAPQYAVIDTQAVSKYDNTFARFNIKQAIEAWYYGPGNNNYGIHLAAERQGEGLLFLNHAIGNAFLDPTVWDGVRDGRPYVTIRHKTLEPIPDDYDLHATTVNLRPFTSYDREGVLQFQTLGFDGIATPASQVDLEVYDVKTGNTIFTQTSGAPNGLRVYPFYEEPLYPNIPQAQMYYGRESNWQAANRLYIKDLEKDTEYGVRVRAQRVDDSGNITETGNWVEGDHFQIYRASGFDRVPRIMNFYGLTNRNVFMYDNHMQDELVFENNEVFLRNPTKNQGLPYISAELSEEDKKNIDFSLIGRGKHCEFGYEPINLNTGNFYYTNEDASWFEYDAQQTLTRSYNSLAQGTESIFGRNWSFTWDKQLTFLESGSAVYDDGTGRRLIFTKQTDGTYTAPAGEQLELTKETVGDMDYTEDTAYYDKIDEQPITRTTQLPVYEFVIKTKDDQSYRFTVDGYLKEAVLDQYNHRMRFEYNEQKFLQKIITPSQKSFEFAYNADGYVSTIRQPDGNLLGYAYDDKGNLTAFTDASGHTLTYTYQDANNPYLMTSYLDREHGEAIIENTFDAIGRVLKQVDAKGDVVTFNYQTEHTEITSFDGSKEYVYFDAQQRTSKSIAKDGTVKTFTYDANNNLASIDDGQHKEDVYTFDKQGNLLTETRADGKAKIYSYDAENNPISVINFDDTKTEFTYDAQKNIIGVLYPNGTQLTYTYNTDGQKTKEIDATGNELTYTYDMAGNIIAITDSFGTKTKAYDALSMITKEIDALGNITEYIRNERGELIEQRTPNGIKTYTYDADGQKIYETDAKNNPKSYTYDAWSRVIEETDSYGTKKYTYDAYGNKLTSTDELGHTTTFTYDAGNRLIKTTNPDGSMTENSYDMSGNLIQTKDVLGNATTFEYDVLGRKTKDIDPKGRETVYAYDVLGNLIQTTYPDGLNETNVYNVLNQVISSTDKKGNVTTYTYDQNGNTLEQNINNEKITKTNFGLANTITAEFDELGNSTTKAYNAVKLAETVTMRNGLTYTYAYDGEYNLIKTTDNLGNSTTSTYDGNRNLLSETDALGFTTTHTYTARNQLASTSYPDGGLLQHVYDAKGQQIATIDQLGHTTETVYDAMGHTIETKDANGNLSQNVYNNKGQLIETIDPLGQSATTTYDNYGMQIETKDVTGKMTTTEYDNLDRVIAQTDSYGFATYTTYNQYGEAIATKNEQGLITKTEYDVYGQVVKTTDMRGNSDETVYDAGGRVQQTKDAKGNISTTTYNGIGQKLTETTMSDNGTIISESFYNTQGLLERLVTNGDTTSYTYDANNQLLTLVLPTGATTSYTYTFDGKEATVTDPNGGITQSFYDQKGQLIKTIDPLGNSSQTVYDANGNTIETIDPLGQSEHMAYDALNRVIKQTDKNGNVTTQTYNAWNQPLIIILPNNTTRAYTYDTQGRVIATKNVPCDTCSGTQGNAQYTSYDAYSRKQTVTYENDYEETYHYTMFGDIEKITNNLGETREENIYDDFGRLIKKYDANRNQTTYEYNNKDQIIKTTAANGNTITYTYNTKDKLATMQDIRGNLTEYQYDAIGNMLAMKLPGERDYTYTYDGNSNMTQEVDANGAITSYQYDLNNQVTKTTNALGHTTASSYTATGKVATQTDARGNTIRYEYDANGNNTRITDELGEQLTYSYDEMNRLAIVKNRNGAVTSYGYDTHNNQSYTMDAKGNMVRFHYDNMNNLTEVKNPDGTKETYRYDQKGNKTREQKQDGRAITYRYDALNNQIYKGFDDKQYAYSYNSEHQITEVKDGSTGTRYTYNNVGDLVSYQDANGNTVSYAYDEIGRRSALIYPDGKRVTYSYDKNSNLLEVDDNGNKTTYNYDAINRLIQTDLPNNMTTTYSYDENGNTTSLHTFESSTNTTVTEMTYVYDERNLVIEETTNIEGTIINKTYTYDAEEQLIASSHTENGQTKTYAYDYDVNGNKISAKETINGKVTARQFAFDTANKLTEETGEFDVTYKYDTAGNVKEKQHQTTGLIERFSYNAEGQLIQVENSEGKVITYSYDGFGNRTQKIEKTALQANNRDKLVNIAKPTNEFNEHYDMELGKQVTKEKLQNLKETIEDFTQTYDQACPIVTTDNQKESHMVLNYVNDINAEYTEVLQIQSNNYQPLYTYTYGNQRITNEKANDTKTYYQYDAKGSVIGQQTQDNGALRLKISYNDYGQPDRKADNEFGYNAEAHDYHGTQYLRARYYNTDTGRFDQRDSYRGEQNNPISQHQYTYVWNSPNQYIDKSGKAPGRESSRDAFNREVDWAKLSNPGVSEVCLQWRVASSHYDNPSSPARMHARKVYHFFLYEHGIPCQSDSFSNSPHKENAGYEAAQEAIRQKDKEENDLKNEIEAAGINLGDIDWKSMSQDERLRLLREIKKICEDYGLFDNWNEVAAKDAQNQINELVKNSQYNEQGMKDVSFWTGAITGGFWRDIIITFLQKGVSTPPPYNLISSLQAGSSSVKSLFKFEASVPGIGAIIGFTTAGALAIIAGIVHWANGNTWESSIALVVFEFLKSILSIIGTAFVVTALVTFFPVLIPFTFLLNIAVAWVLDKFIDYVFSLIGNLVGYIIAFIFEFIF